MMVVVADTSPINYLVLIGEIRLLQRSNLWLPVCSLRLLTANGKVTAQSCY